jgi:SagB-type dehydrogenase family enzyme
MKKILSVLATLLLTGLACAAIQIAAIDLPAPQKTGGMPLFDALAQRSTSRSFDSKDLSPQQLSNLLWSAYGINRPNGKRTAPSARNWQETDIYVLLASGTYLYDAQAHRLKPVVGEDLRALGGTQAFVKDAPVTLVFVADLARMVGGDSGQQRDWAHVDVGYISQNVYLYCTSAGLATGARGYVDKAALGPRLKLRPDQLIVLAQSVGYPKP